MLLPAPRSANKAAAVVYVCAGLLFMLGWLMGSSLEVNVEHAAVGGAAAEAAGARGLTVVSAPKAAKEQIQLVMEGGGGGVRLGGKGKKVPANASLMFWHPRGVPDSAEEDPWLRREQKVWKLIILFQHNLEILHQAVDGFRRASDILAPNIIVVDNSINKVAVSSAQLARDVEEVVPTPRMLNFPELHNHMADLALERGLEFFFWAHADNYVIPIEQGRDMGKDVLHCARLQIESDPSWGMILFSYDHLAAFRTQTMVQVPWDPRVFQYGSECDAYGRIREVGYGAKSCKVHLSYDMKRVLNLTDDMPYAKVKQTLEEDKLHKFGRNRWREEQMDEHEQKWRTEMKLASRKYLQKKWGKLGCKVRGLPCSKGWPYCPKCPEHIPDCYDKVMSPHRLRILHKDSRNIFATDPEQPLAFETFKG